VSEFVSLRKYL